jgi:hypothetical protein
VGSTRSLLQVLSSLNGTGPTGSCTAAAPSSSAGPTDLGTSLHSYLCTAPHDLHHRVLGKPDVAADQPIGQTVAVHGAHLLRLLVGGAMADLATQDDATAPGGLEA